MALKTPDLRLLVMELFKRKLEHDQLHYTNEDNIKEWCNFTRRKKFLIQGNISSLKQLICLYMDK